VIPSLVVAKVEQLGSGSFEERELATVSLRSMPVADEVLMAVLEKGGLDEEQRNRMLGVLRWRVLHRPRGAVGIRMEPAASGIRGVLVTEVIKDLPAERVLRVGDGSSKPIGPHSPRAVISSQRCSAFNPAIRSE
jgi:hypothetical protein